MFGFGKKAKKEEPTTIEEIRTVLDDGEFTGLMDRLLEKRFHETWDFNVYPVYNSEGDTYDLHHEFCNSSGNVKIKAYSKRGNHIPATTRLYFCIRDARDKDKVVEYNYFHSIPGYASEHRSEKDNKIIGYFNIFEEAAIEQSKEDFNISYENGKNIADELVG
jgi:hypothetical protein